MRTTLSIDDDVLAAAKHVAEREGIALGAALSALARRGLTKPASAEGTKRNGIPLLKARSNVSPVTSELVQRLHDELP